MNRTFALVRPVAASTRPLGYFLGSLLLASNFLWSATPAPPSKYVIDLALGTSMAPLAAKYGFTVLRSWKEPSEIDYSVSTPAPLSKAVLGSLAAERGVVHVEADAEFHTSETETSSKIKLPKLETLGDVMANRSIVNFANNRVLSIYADQPGISIVHAREASKAFGGYGKVVAIVDTGVDFMHPALHGALLPGFDFTRDSALTVSELNDLDPATRHALQQSTVEFLDSKEFVPILQQSTVEFLDQSTVEFLDGKGLPSAFGHGTMVAGLVHLVAPYAKIMPLKAFHADGSASLFDIARAIRYAADQGADVISMSFSYPSDSLVLKDAIVYAQTRGSLCISSSGNAGKNTLVYPASYPEVIGVGSTNFSDKRSPFSNFGNSARTAAPGEALITLFPGGNYAAVWGTSFSTALVSGATGMMRFLAPNMRSGSLQDALDRGQPVDLDMGDARLDVLKSLTWCSHESYH